MDGKEEKNIKGKERCHEKREREAGVGGREVKWQLRPGVMKRDASLSLMPS